ncbi:hypothetical protein VNI00_016648 [Paramarasmius palmivorus]|uniref:Uncharacterized protein n=1 Tax=Paramarasmius palmivorus TaxID=297713 RepID=A0AAW0ATH6_9AGAR
MIQQLFQILPHTIDRLVLRLDDSQPMRQTLAMPHILPNVTNLTLTTTPCAIIDILALLPGLRTADVSVRCHDDPRTQRRFTSPPVEVPILQSLTIRLVRHFRDHQIGDFLHHEAPDIRDLLFHINPISLQTLTLHWKVPMSFTQPGPLREGLESLLTRTSHSLRQFVILNHVDLSYFDPVELSLMMEHCGIWGRYEVQPLVKTP